MALVSNGDLNFISYRINIKNFLAIDQFLHSSTGFNIFKIVYKLFTDSICPACYVINQTDYLLFNPGVHCLS
jgi:hypothetical protein